MENTFSTALATSALAALVTSIGIYTIRRFADWGHRNTTYFMCFAAGVLISASFLHIIPKSFSMNPQAPIWLLVGFLGLHMFNRFFTAFVCEKDPDKKEYAIGVVPMLGIGFHSFIDGFIYSIAFTVSILTGFLATMGMVLHEFPEGIITYLLLVRGGFSERKSMFLAFLAVGGQYVQRAMNIPFSFIEAISALLVLGVLLGRLLTEYQLVTRQRGAQPSGN